MATKAGSSLAIELPKLETPYMHIKLVGDTPLIVHAWSQKAKKEILDKQMGKAVPKKAKKDPVQDFEESLYRVKDGYGFPSVGFKAAAVTACTSVGGITKVSARQAFHVMGDQVEIPTAFDPSRTMRMDLARIEGSEPELREDMTKVGMGTADIRYRAQFWPWHATILVRFNVRVLTAEQIVNLFNTAGFGVGVGEWRPERDGNSGMFHVATDEEV
jgi:hypothetical protein